MIPFSGEYIAWITTTHSTVENRTKMPRQYSERTTVRVDSSATAAAGMP